MRTRSPLVLGLAVLATGCSAFSSSPRKIEFIVSPARKALFSAFTEFLPADRVGLTTRADPAAAVADAGDDSVRVAVVADLDCSGCYRLERAPGGFVVHGGAPLGIQYGAARMLEALGFRFFHPFDTYVPKTLTDASSSPALGKEVHPAIRLRGLHLHTLHPIEAYFALWEPGADNLRDARRIIDWLIKNRGNNIDWPALDNVLHDGTAATAWRAHTKKILAYAHARGITAGIGVQLFGSSNLQHAFDLLDSNNASAAPRDAIAARYHTLLDGLDFDWVNLSFGEFFGSDPDTFISDVDLAYDVLQKQAPGTKMSALVHVGTVRVQYMGQSIPYYFLVKYTNPAIVPWIHTVMYYDLVEDAGGAYGQKDFSDHRAFLLDRLSKCAPVGYEPEDAYWVAFDDSVPTYLPLYIRSRWLDLTRIRDADRSPGNCGLDQHILFSTGWEWGYWQNDYAALHMSYSLPSDWWSTLRNMFAPLGARGATLARVAGELGDIEHDFLIDRRLAPYLAGRDISLDLGRKLGIISQPDRPTFTEVAALSPTDRVAFEHRVIAPLAEFADALAPLADELDGVAGDGPWASEMRDGVAVTMERARFIGALYSAALAHGDVGGGGWLARADDALKQAQDIVSRRHAALHDPDPDRLLQDGANATTYQWGYLKQANDLCYWQRERTKVENLLTGQSNTLPTCLL